ncbi:ATP-binding protein [Amycolatopsis sp. cg9]|uniref:ATP-binding protein n=1 Tax=Amycolatopsis sp. cg9 TaxID=3238801 RepID=UPI0035263F45
MRANLSIGDAELRLHGLSSAISRETRDRVRAAIRNSGLSWPSGVVHLTASTARPRSDVDLAAAAAALLVTGAVPVRRLTATALIGELGLDGTVRPVPDVAPRAIAAADAGFTHLVVPAATAAEASAVPGLTIIPVTCLDDLVSWLRGNPAPALQPEPGKRGPSETSWDPEGWARLSPAAVRAAAAAAAGGHHTVHLAAPNDPVLLLPRLIRTLMADLTDTDALEVSRWHSQAGELLPDSGVRTRPPGVSLHPTDTIAAIVGSVSRPGLLTLAHRGVLTVEDLPDFSARTLEVIRSEMQDCALHVAAAGGATSRPAGPRTVFTVRDCLCGYAQAENCRCTPRRRARYLARIPLWLLDCTDLFVRQVTVAVPDPSPPLLESLRDAVARARERVRSRWGTAPEPGAEIDYTHAVADLPAGTAQELDDAIREGRIRPARRRGASGSPGHAPTWTTGRTRTSPTSC